MKHLFIHTILFLTLISVPGQVTGQTDFPVEIIESDQYLEQIIMITDRKVYASGEPVYFRVYNNSPRQLKEHQWSKVLYVEVLNSLNTRVAQGKYELEPRGASGQVLIPDSVTTGTYFIRGYTKWMRNYPASGYAHLPLIIINPYQSAIRELIPQSAANYEQTDRDSLSESGGSAAGQENSILCFPDKKIYAKREKITLNIQSNDPDGLPEGFSISVARKGCNFASGIYSPGNVPDKSLTFSEGLYYPESQGLSVYGTITNADDGQVIPYTKVFLTLLGDNPDCYEITTDRNGKFRSSIPYYTGSQDVLITALPRQDLNIKINIENEFSDDFTAEYPDITVSTSSWWTENRELVQEIMINSQVMQAFRSVDTLSHVENDESSDLAFYGTPDFRYYTRDYIPLPNLEEFFFELVPNVILKSEKRRNFFVVTGELGNLMYHPPIILIDYVPVFNINEFLNLSPSNIEYIDIINSLYIRGSNYYGGIINLISKKGDRAGMSLPDNAAFFRFSTFTKQVEMVYSNYSEGSTSDRIPDLRTSLYWDPDIRISNGNSRSLEFYASDVVGSFVVVIQAVSADGQIVRHTAEFVVE